jgi:hypothetical protein
MGDATTTLPRRAPAATASVVAAWCLIAIGDSLHAGYFSNTAFACVAAGVALIVATAAAGRPLISPGRGLIAVPVVVGLTVALVDPSGAYLYLGSGHLHVLVGLDAATVAAVAAALLAPARWRQSLWRVSIVLAAATGITTIVFVDNPNIDVWQLLQQSSSGLLHGDDMYRQHWAHSTGLQEVYPYLPASTLVLAPFRWLSGDVRFGLLAATLLAVVLVARRRGSDAAPVAALLYVVPAWPLLVNRSWTEPELVLALAAAVLAIGSRRGGIAVLALGVALASKQPIVLLLPVFAIWPGFGWRRTAAACAAGLAIVAPWLIAGPRDFWHDAVHAQLALPVKPSSLSLPGLLLRHGDRAGFWLLAIALALGYAVVAWRIPRTTSGLALACATVMALYDIANKQTYFNHYMLPLGLLVVALATAGREPSAGVLVGDLRAEREDRRGAAGAADT